MIDIATPMNSEKLVKRYARGRESWVEKRTASAAPIKNGARMLAWEIATVA